MRTLWQSGKSDDKENIVDGMIKSSGRRSERDEKEKE
jgi:hypothetical protein